MKLGCLFSGIGGLEAGLSRAIPDAQTVWQVEQDEYARAVLAKHWPDTRRFEDVREVGAHNLEPVDLICGGFPCQDISVAGRGAGIDGKRSGLWSEFARIIGELVPRYAVMENSPALNSRGMGRVLGDLAALGYDAIWDCIPAAAVGAPHRRDRVFIIAYTNSERRRKEQKRQLRRKDSAELGHDGKAQFVARFKPDRSVNSKAWASCAGIRRVAAGVPHRVDRLRCLGNAVVPQVAEVVGRVVVELEQEQRRALSRE